MSIQVKFNPELALRPYETEGRKEEECVPKKIEEGQTYIGMKEGLRNFYLPGEVSLRIYNGKGLSKPLASIRILEITHFMEKEKIWSKVKYRVIKNLESREEPYFNGFEPIHDEKDPQEVK